MFFGEQVFYDFKIVKFQRYFRSRRNKNEFNANFRRGVTRTRRRRTPVDPARPFTELDWSSSTNGRAESVLGPAWLFTELDWSSSANGRAKSVLDPARPFAELDYSSSSSANGQAESVFDDRVCLFRRTDPLDL